LQGSVEEKLKQVEKILPRIIRRTHQEREIITPDSMVSFFSKEPNENGLIFSLCAFECTIKKLCFSIEALQGKDKPYYQIEVIRKGESRSFFFETKKMTHVQAFDFRLSDGDIIKFKHQNQSDQCQLMNIHVSLLLSLGSQAITKERVPLEELDYEGI